MAGTWAEFFDGLLEDYPALRDRTVVELAPIFGYRSDRQIRRWRSSDRPPPAPAQRRIRESVEAWQSRLSGDLAKGQKLRADSTLGIGADTKPPHGPLIQPQPLVSYPVTEIASNVEAGTEGIPMVLSEAEALVILAWRKHGVAKAKAELEAAQGEPKARGRLQRSGRKK